MTLLAYLTVRRTAGWILFAAAIAAAYEVGVQRSRWRGSAEQYSDREVLFWVDPMHPSYRSDKPGIAPDCGMELQPVFADGGAPSVAAKNAPRGTIRVTEERQQLIGMRVARVEHGAETRSIRTTGRVAAEEGRLFRINAATDMWVRSIFSATTGSFVRKDQPLLGFYSPTFPGAANVFVYALEGLARAKSSSSENAQEVALATNQVRQAIQALENIGVSDQQIDAMERTRKIGSLVELVSPSDGFILRRNATVGERIMQGTELFQIADLRKVWVFGDLFGDEAQDVKPGLPAKVLLPHQQTTFAGRVSNVAPQFDAVTRAFKLRIELDNPRFILRPEMFVDVEFSVQSAPSLFVNAEAVIDSGTRKTVFVDRGGGFFEPRQVQTGARFGDKVEIVRGLEAGEKIVVSGTFLLDSESRMRTPTDD